MKNAIGVTVLLIASAAMIAAPVLAADTITKTGEIIDSACYIAKGAKGAGHIDCAKKCAEAGIPLALLEDGSEDVIWLTDSDHTPANDTLVQYAGKRVKVTGTLAERGGAKLLVISSVEPAS